MSKARLKCPRCGRIVTPTYTAFAKPTEVIADMTVYRCGPLAGRLHHCGVSVWFDHATKLEVVWERFIQAMRVRRRFMREYARPTAPASPPAEGKA